MENEHEEKDVFVSFPSVFNIDLTDTYKDFYQDCIENKIKPSSFKEIGFDSMHLFLVRYLPLLLEETLKGLSDTHSEFILKLLDLGFSPKVNIGIVSRIDRDLELKFNTLNRQVKHHPDTLVFFVDEINVYSPKIQVSKIPL